MGSCQACRATYVLHIQGSRPMQKGNLDFEWQSRDNEEEEEEDEEYITMIYILRRA